MHLLKLCVLSLAFAILTGCGTFLPPIPLSSEFNQAPGEKVGIAVRCPDAPYFSPEGNIGLLDHAIISAAMSSLREHTKTLDLSEFKIIDQEIAYLLHQQDFKTRVLSEFPDVENLEKFVDPDKKDTVYYAIKDMMPLAKTLAVDYLLIIDLFRAGFARPYEAFVPLASPRAVFDIRGQLVDLRNNRLLWHSGINKTNSPDGTWDEPPTFPGLTNSYYISLEEAKSAIIDVFTSKPIAEEKIEDESLQAGL